MTTPTITQQNKDKIKLKIFTQRPLLHQFQQSATLKNMKKALFAGTFDPPTLGHLDIIQRAHSVCDRLYVGVAVNAEKKTERFSLVQKLEMLRTICAPYPYVEVVSFATLSTQFAKENKIDFLLRGLRAFSDLEHEMRMAFTNRRLSGIETLFLMADDKVAHISSTLTRELGSYQTRLHDFVPAEIEPQVFAVLSQPIPS